MPIFRYPFFYNNYGNYYNRPIPYGSNNNLHINNNEYRPENFESKPQENPNKPLEEKKLNDDEKRYQEQFEKYTQKKQEDSNYFFELFGLKLYFDDILLICLIFFLYQEGVKDDELFISLILLLLS